MPVEDSQQQVKSQSRKRQPALSPELREVLNMLKTLETKPAAG